MVHLNLVQVIIRRLNFPTLCGQFGKMQRPLPREDCLLKEISPHLGGGGTYGLDEQMEFFFVRIIKAKNLPPNEITGSCNPYVEVRHGNYKGTTSHFEQKTNPEWNQVFVFPHDQTQASTVEVVVKDRYMVNDDFIGMVEINLDHIPRLVGPDSALAPRLCRLENQKSDEVNGELSLTVWIGTQTNEAFPEARHLDADETVPGDNLVVNTGSRVYHSPKLWYIRVYVFEAGVLQDDVKKAGYPEVFVRARLGNQDLKTRNSMSGNTNPVWKEEFMFVAAEPFEEPLVISVEERLGLTKDKVLGKTDIDLQINAKRRLDNEEVSPRWYDLQNHVVMEGDQKENEVKYTGRISLGISLDGGYHVLDESSHYTSDLRPSEEQLWKPSIGILELDILGAQGLCPMKSRDGRGTADAYCVAKYGREWFRTRTVIDSLAPGWNERYTWEVYDLFNVITVAVFDNCHFQEGGTVATQKDKRIGKVRIRLSTLETGRDYTHSYPLLVLQPSGLKKTGEIHLAVRCTCSSMLKTMHTYTKPLLPKMHYLCPLSVMQLDNLRFRAVQIIATRLSGEEPPLKREVVEYMTDVDSHMWSLRRTKANFFRIMAVFNSFFGAIKWFDQICNWKNPWTTVLIHLVFVILVLYPELILPAIFLYLFLDSVWNRRFWPRYPPHMDVRLSHADAAHPDELDEEFDTFPTSRSADLVRMRYDRLRSVAGRVQTVVGDLATQGERLQYLSSGRDPRATNLFTVFCLILAIILYFRPRIVALLTGFYVMRHPRFRHPLPLVPLNFFRRLPSRADTLL